MVRCAEPRAWDNDFPWHIVAAFTALSPTISYTAGVFHGKCIKTPPVASNWTKEDLRRPSRLRSGIRAVAALQDLDPVRLKSSSHVRWRKSDRTADHAPRGRLTRRIRSWNLAEEDGGTMTRSETRTTHLLPPQGHGTPPSTNGGPESSNC